MTTYEHPGTRLKEEVIRRLSAFSHEAEMSGDLHPQQLALLHEQHWFRMFIPKTLGGLGLTLPEVVRLEEALAWADGSTAWVATLCAGAGWFVGFVNPSVAKEFFTGKDVCIAGSGNASGTAKVTPDGFRINGSWPYASGALHATAFTANCVIHGSDGPLVDDQGTERIMPFVLKPMEVTIAKTWGATGMIATASHSFSVTDIIVPAERCFEIQPSAAKLPDAVYRYPFLQLAETTLAANIAGMTVRFLDLAAACAPECVQSKNGMDTRRNVVSDYKIQLNRLRESFFEKLDESWERMIESNNIEDSVLQQVSQLSLELARVCRSAIDVIYPLCSLQIASNEGELNLVWRNIDTALSHALFRRRLASEPLMNP